ncbi:MAG: biotin--[acetyl-CoA-carboxylase] ligase [Cyclobacteriaceae bacterium]
MHKIFAKTLFLGKKVLFLPQCHSTNDELTQMVKKESLPEGTLIYTDHQVSGRGQRGNSWNSSPQLNVLTSFLVKPYFLPPGKQFYLTMVIGMAVYDALKELGLGNVKIKWPNDIYVGDLKIAGVLVEASISGSLMENVVIGLGLNVNQMDFGQLNATSVKLETGHHYHRNEVLEQILICFEKWYLLLKAKRHDEISHAYHEKLMWIGETRTFKAGNIFKGVIQGVDQQGRLIISHDGANLTYDIKEVQFIN